MASVIFNAVSTGTPLVSSVESVRANWPNRFRRTTLPKMGAFIVNRSILRRPSGVPLKRTQNTTATEPTIPMINQFVALPKNVLMFIKIRVANGNGTLKPVKIDMNFGSMKVMKKMMITTPTQATTQG